MRKFKGFSSMQHSASRARSPPLNTFTFLSTSSPLNMKAPSMARTRSRFSSLAAYSAVSITVPCGFMRSGMSCA